MPTTRQASGIGNNDYTANFVDFLDAAPKDTPWCFWYGCTEPHRAYEFQSGVKKGGKKLGDIKRVPDYWPDHETVRHDMLDYAFEVEHADQHLARMIAELEQRGQLDNTLVIVTSDHGMPFPRVKGYAYHDSNHVPLAIRWPAGVRRPGRIIEDFVDFTDLAPTLLDYAGITQADSGMMPITGRSWRPILESEKGGVVLPDRDHVLIGKERTDVGRPHDWGYPIRGIVTATHLYLKNYEPTRWPAGNPETGYLDTDGSPTKSLILSLGRENRADRLWRFNFGMRPAEELYDLHNDADCTHNVAADSDQAVQLKSLRERMESTLTAQQDPRMFGKGQVFDEYPPTAGAGFYENTCEARDRKPAGSMNRTSSGSQSAILVEPVTDEAVLCCKDDFQKCRYRVAGANPMNTRRRKIGVRAFCVYTFTAMGLSQVFRAPKSLRCETLHSGSPAAGTLVAGASSPLRARPGTPVAFPRRPAARGPGP